MVYYSKYCVFYTTSSYFSLSVIVLEIEQVDTHMAILAIFL